LCDMVTGEIRIGVAMPIHGREKAISTPDGRIVILMGDRTILWKDGVEVPHSLPSLGYPVLSPDGRWLVHWRNPRRAGPEWIRSVTEWFGQPHSSIDVFDLNCLRQIASFPSGGKGVWFSSDRKTMAISTGRAIELYDVPSATSFSPLATAQVASLFAIAAFGVFHSVRFLAVRMRSERDLSGCA
jgi:hypothetical protein